MNMISNLAKLVLELVSVFVNFGVSILKDSANFVWAFLLLPVDLLVLLYKHPPVVLVGGAILFLVILGPALPPVVVGLLIGVLFIYITG